MSILVLPQASHATSCASGLAGTLLTGMQALHSLLQASECCKVFCGMAAEQRSFDICPSACVHLGLASASLQHRQQQHSQLMYLPGHVVMYL